LLHKVDWVFGALLHVALRSEQLDVVVGVRPAKCKRHDVVKVVVFTKRLITPASAHPALKL
jgi:uncharacterized membrane protein